ncbi:hypothetical protein [Bifidobacterium crudilactis]|jgi:hypothetical protein|uniref:Uncharacterized protein n=2 Tax=Bifidobacterium crudilactis TaxID=327277 RepID=A0A971CYS7_9BIFI|nr:hypothetical protein [Bifidobacterium crudilactis]MCI1868209.1 hypothetical protein [Bifidobacterium crudilactis]MDN5972788.1 hypothetical protein [Bifidobacterium crudilactis]MDN6000880.1 hypothetical protein [Bifidobacterium crudilactis]MDN6209336.1 hypothetical protein [Bifidobacterium crudilactis]MDN6233553.1 hypothetical protein [Bifidobacterium crudilactis]
MSGETAIRLSLCIAGVAASIIVFLATYAAQRGDEQARDSEVVVVRYPKSMVLFVRLLSEGSLAALAVMIVVGLTRHNNSMIFGPLLLLVPLAPVFLVFCRFVATSRMIIEGQVLHITRGLGFKRFEASPEQIGSWRLIGDTGDGIQGIRIKDTENKTLFTARYSMSHFALVEEWLIDNCAIKQTKFKLFNLNIG